MMSKVTARLQSRSLSEAGVQGAQPTPGVWGCPPQFSLLKTRAEQRDSDAKLSAGNPS